MSCFWVAVGWSSGGAQRDDSCRCLSVCEGTEASCTLGNCTMAGKLPIALLMEVALWLCSGCNFACCSPFLYSDGLQAVQEYSRRIHGVIMAQSLPIVSEPSSLIPLSTTETPSAKYIRTSNENMGGLNFADDLPVLVTNADLADYQGIQDAGLVGNQIWHDLGVVYRVRFIATRRVVNAMSVARASAAWARFSCVWLGCQAENVVLGASMRLDQLSSSEVISHASIGLPSTCLGRMNFSGLNLPVCQSGIVNG